MRNINRPRYTSGYGIVWYVLLTVLVWGLCLHFMLARIGG